MNDDEAIRAVVGRIDAAWRHKRFDGLPECFHEDAVIVGPGHVEFARGRQACTDSYITFANDASVLAYSEDDAVLRRWGDAAVWTFSWQMDYRRGETSSRERGTDLLVLERARGGWQVVFRHIDFESAP
jgi:uncharacterized protein (TIGR02246 family)